MRGKVFRSLKNSPGLRAKFRKATTMVDGRDQSLVGKLAHVGIDRSSVDAFFIRLTKGLLAKIYPEVDRNGLEFMVSQLSQFSGSHPTFEIARKCFQFDQRGDGVFQFWRSLAVEDQRNGVWVFQFFHAAMFLVCHGVTKDSIPGTWSN